MNGDFMRRKINKALYAAFALAMLLLCVLMPSEISGSVYDSLLFCGRTIIPQVFVGMVISSLAADMPLPKFISGKARTVLLLVICMLCGFPNGAVTAKRLYDTGTVDKNGAEIFCACSGSVSASFMMGFVAETTKNSIAAAILLASQIAISVAIFCFMPFECGYANESRKSVVAAIKGACINCLGVCGMIIFFSLPMALLQRYICLSEGTAAILKGIFEFSSGVASAKGDLKATAVICGFGGLCVTAQVKSVLENRLSAKPFLAVRVISGALMCGLMALYEFFA